MMRQGTAQLNSSEGFKRRLIRPSSSRGVDRNQQYLKTFDISQSETTIATIAKADLNALQEDINSIDIDKKIRTDDISLGKSYVTTLKKWLKQVQNSPNQEEDEVRILKTLNVDNVTAGFKKVWKIAQCLDAMLVKSNELHAIAFLKYDELFSTLAEENIKITSKKLNMVGQGFSGASSQMASVYVERIQDVYSLISKIKKGDKSNSKQQLNETKAESQKLVKQLQEENEKLSRYLEEMMKKSEEKVTVAPIPAPVPVSKPVEAPQNVKVQKSALDVAISQISSSYQQQLEDLTNKLKKALDSQAHLKLQNRSLRQTIQSSKKQSKQNKPAPSLTYQATLKQQIESMKKGYESKISKIKQDYLQREKQLMRKENEYRIENQKIRFQRQLLMKKYDLTK